MTDIKGELTFLDLKPIGRLQIPGIERKRSMGNQTALQRRATALQRRIQNREGGFSLAELLIVMAVIAIVGGLVAATLIQTSQTSSRYSESTMTQAELLDSISHVTRQISLATSITLAGDDYLQLEAQEDGKKVVTTIFYHSPGVTPDGRYGLSAGAELPDFPSIIEHRKKADGSETIRILVNNYAPSVTQPLFTYFDRQNQQMRTPVDAIELGSIERIAVWLTSVVENRGTDGEDVALELATSATPRLAMQSGTTIAELEAPATPILRGTLAPRTQVANLAWSNVAGATSYILFRENSNQNPVRTSIDLSAGSFASTEPSYTDPNRVWGETYQYSVVAVGPGGLSGESNKVALTVVPQQPAFLLVDPNNHAANATSARGLENRLNWTPRNGADGYRLYRGATLIYTGTATAFSDTGRAYGDSTQYTVVAFNSGQNGSGGNSFTSAAVTLISPPVAPTLTGSHASGTRNLSWNAPANAQRYELDRTAPSAATWATTSRTYADAQAIDSASFTYRVRAGNAAGFGPYSSNAAIAARPGSPAVAGQDYQSHPATRDGRNYVYWQTTANAQDYEWRRGGGGVNSTSALAFDDNGPGWGSTQGYEVRACNITGCGAWGSVTLRQPPAPFAINGVWQEKRSGQAPRYTNEADDFPLIEQAASLSWSSAAGASTYQLNRHDGVVGVWGSGQLSSGAGYVIPGGQYIFAVVATAPNGLQRSTSNYHLQISPAQVSWVQTTAETTDGRYSRNPYWGNVAPVTGWAHGAYSRTIIQHGSTVEWDTDWQPWGGQTVYTGTWDKSRASSGAGLLGGMQMTSTVINIPGGYSTGSVSQRAHNGNGTGIEGIGAGHHSWTTYMAFRSGISRNWAGTYNGNWQRVQWTTSNFPSNNGHDYAQYNGR